MSKHPELARFLQGLIRAEKARHGLTFEDLSQRLRHHGIRQSATNLRTKLSRGDMSAQLFLALAKVLDLKVIALDSLHLASSRRTRRR